MFQMEGTACTRLKGKSVHGGVGKLSTPLSLGHGKQGSKPIGEGEDMPSVSGGQEQSDVAGRKG